MLHAMRGGPRLLMVCALLAAGSAIGAAASAQPSDAPRASAPRLVVNVYTRNDHGRVFCAIWRGAEGYPTRRERNVGETLDRTIVNRTAQCVFDGLPPGEYAVAVFHDENANNDLDRNFLGIPSEGTGASNDAHNMFGPPSYSDARFQLRNVPLQQIQVRIHY